MFGPLLTRADGANEPQRIILPNGRPAIETRYAFEARGRTLKFRAYRYTNAQGELEVAYEFEEMRFLLPSTHVVVLYGRDLNRDGRMDAWFMPRETMGVMESLDRTAYDKGDGWVTARDLLLHDVRLHERNYLELLVQAASSSFTWTGGSTKAYFEDLTQRELNLYDAEIRAHRLWKLHPTDPGARQLFEWVRDGWAEIGGEVGLFGSKFREHLVLVLVDVGTAVIGAKAASWIGPRLIPAQVRMWAKTMSDRFLAALTLQARQVAARIPTGAAAATAAASTRQAALLTVKTVTERIVIGIRAMESRSILERWAAKGLLKAGYVTQKGLEHVPYISLVIGTLTASELVSRHGEHLQGADGPVLYLKNAATNQDMIQSLLYMSDETFLQAAITASSRKVVPRMMITGVVSTVDSYAVGSFLKGNADPNRLRVDVIWQATAGNIQTNLDMAAVEYFEKAALKSANPRWKLAGWALVVASQFGGMIAYEKAVDMWARADRQDTPTDAELKKLTDKAEVRLMPIVTDAVEM